MSSINESIYRVYPTTSTGTINQPYKNGSFYPELTDSITTIPDYNTYTTDIYTYGPDEVQDPDKLYKIRRSNSPLAEMIERLG